MSTPISKKLEQKYITPPMVSGRLPLLGHALRQKSQAYAWRTNQVATKSLPD